MGTKQQGVKGGQGETEYGCTKKKINQPKAGVLTEENTGFEGGYKRHQKEGIQSYDTRCVNKFSVRWPIFSTCIITELTS